MTPSKRPRTALLFLAALALPAAVASAQAPTPAAPPTLAVGAVAPAYTLPDQDGKPHTLAADKGKVVLLAFYPADFTGGCTIEAHSLTAADKDFKALGVQVYGVSVQDPNSHKAFCTKEGIPYTLLADTEKTASKAYGVLPPGKNVASRVTFIIDANGKVAYVDKAVNSHLQTCGDDWVTWLKAHPQVTATTAAIPIIYAGSGPYYKSLKYTGSTPMLSITGPATLGKPAPAFALPDAVSGADTSLASTLTGKKATVVMFISTRCPISNGYNERMTALAEKYAAQGVAFVAINANHNEPISEIKAHALDHKFPFPVLKDASDTVADAYDAHVTPETYVINSSGILVYHGRIDNSVDPSEVATHDLAAALDETLAGKPVTKARLKAFGCSIKRAQ